MRRARRWVGGTERLEVPEAARAFLLPCKPGSPCAGARHSCACGASRTRRSPPTRTPRSPPRTGPPRHGGGCACPPGRIARSHRPRLDVESSGVISGNQWQSVAIRGNQWRSHRPRLDGARQAVAISGNQWPSGVIGGSSVALAWKSSHQGSSVVIRGHQWHAHQDGAPLPSRLPHADPPREQVASARRDRRRPPRQAAASPPTHT